MDKNSSIIVTGAAGFIGSCLVGYLNTAGYNNIIIVDDFSRQEKKPNYQGKNIRLAVEREGLFSWLGESNSKVDFVFHLGARTDTTEFDYSILKKLNVDYSKKIWQFCVEKNIPLVYASSAATYGSGEFGYKDDHETVEKLRPLNPYGVSKNEFDQWALSMSGNSAPPFWAGLKFFNVYGPNEYHKKRMASVVFHAFNQIQSTGKVKLFRSHKAEFKDGEQLRDFIYVEDVIKICYWFMQQAENRAFAPGLYNVGTGQARTFNDQVNSIFSALDRQAVIEYIDTPEDIRDKYQYFTEADMSKLKAAGYKEEFVSLEAGVATYVKKFLAGHDYF
jgi:ADP-L-glycero-D-manno-heptose 6-epimerase